MNLFSVSMVKLPKEGIKSQWQAGFMQIFPIDYSSLPNEHESDKEFFVKYWKGKPRNLTFEEFKNKTKKKYP